MRVPKEGMRFKAKVKLGYGHSSTAKAAMMKRHLLRDGSSEMLNLGIGATKFG
jgi:hypothetical protein